MSSNVSRTEHITRNVTVTVITQIVSMLFAFINRTIFIKLLGENYLGLDGLFSSILTIFSLAELGIGNALIFSLYKPIAEDDENKATQLLTLYNKAYRVIIIVILCAGSLLIPFLPKIVNADLSNLDINLYVIYILFLLNTVSSYFLAYRGAILTVNQLQRKVSVIQTSTKITVNIFECILLLAFHSYYIYLLVRVVGNYVSALIIARRAKKVFPSLCIENREPLPKTEVRRIAMDVYALSIRRVGSVVSSSVSSIIINAFISLVMHPDADCVVGGIIRRTPPHKKKQLISLQNNTAYCAKKQQFALQDKISVLYRLLCNRIGRYSCRLNADKKH